MAANRIGDGAVIVHLLTCPACGPFGVRRRRRHRDADAAMHIAWAAHLSAEARAERNRNPLITLWDAEFRRIAGPMPSSRYAAAGVVFEVTDHPDTTRTIQEYAR